MIDMEHRYRVEYDRATYDFYIEDLIGHRISLKDLKEGLSLIRELKENGQYDEFMAHLKRKSLEKTIKEKEKELIKAKQELRGM